MKRLLNLFLWGTILLTTFTSCHDDAVDINEINQQTILVYMPWADNLNTQFFPGNLADIEAGIVAKKGLGRSRVLVFFSHSTEYATLYEYTYTKGKVNKNNIKEFNFRECNYTTAQGITQILNTVKEQAPALNYAMIIGCHGSGWTQKSSWLNYPREAKEFALAKEGTANGYEPTRFFGSVTDINNYGTDISTLRQGIKDAGIKMQYILFDDCYMANVEVAYELREVTNYLIASTSEIMAKGMPYADMWSYLTTATPNYSGMVTAFYKYYSNYTTPCGAIGAINCRQVDSLAVLMKEVNQKFTITRDSLQKVQILDGFSTPLFYDMGDYLKKTCTDKKILNRITAQLDHVVPSKASTTKIYSNLDGGAKYVDVKEFSGITISDPSTHPVAIRGKEQTSWWQATH